MSATLFLPDRNTLKISEREALRYLGYGSKEPDEGTRWAIDRLLPALREEICPRGCYCILPVTVSENGILRLGELPLESYDLCRCLADASSAILFAATLGISTDRFLSRTMARSESDGVIADALASAAVEGLCDALEEYLSEEFPHRRPRFSAGYGDLPLHTQRDLLNAVSAPRLLGLTLTESLMMTPTKSVSAIVGILS